MTDTITILFRAGVALIVTATYGLVLQMAVESGVDVIGAGIVGLVGAAMLTLCFVLDAANSLSQSTGGQVYD